MNDTQPSGQFDQLWAQAIEEHVAGLSDTDFTALVDRTRPKPVSAMSYRELRENIARKSAVSQEKTKARANGGGPYIPHQ